MNRNMKNPLFWHEHPNPWVRRAFVILMTLPLFLVVFPLSFGWVILRNACESISSALTDFFQDLWDDIGAYSVRWWRGLIYCPRIWWQPVDQQATYAKKIQGLDEES